jgi:hypothetical protein
MTRASCGIYTLQYTSAKYPKQDSLISKVSEVRSWVKRRGSTPPPKPTSKPTVPTTLRYELPTPLRDAPDPKSPFRGTLHAPKCVPHVSPYNLRLRWAMTAHIRNATPHQQPPIVSAYPDKLPPTLNLDQHGRPLTYTSAMAGLNKPHSLLGSPHLQKRSANSSTLHYLSYLAFRYNTRPKMERHRLLQSSP